MWKKIKSWFRPKSKEKKETALTPYKPFALVVIGEEMEGELRQMKICDFLSWLKVEDKKVYEVIKALLSQFKDLDVLKYLDKIDDVDKRLKVYLKLWIQDRYRFPFKNEKTTKFLTVSNTTLLTRVFGNDVENVHNFEADDIEGWVGDNSALYHVIVVGYSFSKEKINEVIKHINSQECRAKRNWFFVNDNQEYADDAKAFISTNNLEARIQNWNKYVCTLPITNANRKRRIRYREFRQFRECVEEKFNVLCSEDERGSYYKGRCGFNVLNSNRNGHTEDIVAELFWGSYAYDRNTESNGFHLRIASGCSLVFLRHDNGYVSIFLTPGKTENQESIGTGYVYKKNMNPSKLLNDNFIKELWHLFMAYTECTSLDGEPKWCQKVTYFKLWCFKRKLTNDNIASSRLTMFVRWIGKWVLTVGLSGLLLSLITFAASRCENKKETSKNVNVKGEVVIKVVRQDSIRYNGVQNKYWTKKGKGVKNEK